MQIWDAEDQPNWVVISHKYADLARTTQELGADVSQYKATLSALDGLGTSISNGTERVFLLREEIARLEGKK